MAKLLICLPLALVMAGCGDLMPAPTPLVDENKPFNENYLDVQVGWRLRVVAPILKSGGSLGVSGVEQTGSSDLQVKASPDFLGYETQYYEAKKAGRGGSLKVQFASAKVSRDGLEVSETEPRRNYFPPADRCRFLRLIYLVRASETQHDMAVLWGRSPAEIHERSEHIQEVPAACGTEGDWCYWIPKGVAVRAEKQNDAGDWVPVL